MTPTLSRYHQFGWRVRSDRPLLPRWQRSSEARAHLHALIVGEVLDAIVVRRIVKDLACGGGLPAPRQVLECFDCLLHNLGHMRSVYQMTFETQFGTTSD
jgi:hypothetical protein